MQGFIRKEDLWTLMVRHKLDQTMLPEYLPPEGKPGYTAPPEDVELRGFKRDFDDVVLEPVFKKFPFGGERHEIAEYLDKLANTMRSYSAGNYLYATLHELIPTIAPDYVVQRKDAPVALHDTPPANAQQPVSAVLETFRTKYPDAYAQDVLDDLQKRLPAEPTVMMAFQTLTALAKDYAADGDDYKAETADLLRVKLGQMQPARNAPKFAP